MTVNNRNFMSAELKDKILNLYFNEGVTSWVEIARRLEFEFEAEFPGLSISEIGEKIRLFVRRKKNCETRSTDLDNKNCDDNNVDDEATYRSNTTPPEEGPTSVEYKADGSVIFADVIALTKGELITPEIIMNAHHLDPTKWEVLSLKSNVWQGMGAGDTTKTLYQSKLTVKP